VADDALATWVHGTPEMGPRVERIRPPNPAAKKKAVVAIARQLAVDLWRVFTGQVEAEKFGLVYLPEAA
jgi:hypothetical protein